MHSRLNYRQRYFYLCTLHGGIWKNGCITPLDFNLGTRLSFQRQYSAAVPVWNEPSVSIGGVGLIFIWRTGERISYADRNSNPESFRPHLSQYND